MRKAPKGCFWRDGVLWGRAKVKGRDRKWSLRTDDPKLAKERRAAGKARLVAHLHYGDARFTFDEALAQWAPWVKRQVGEATAERYAVSLDQLAVHLSGLFLDEVSGQLVADIVKARQLDVTNATIKRDLGALSSVMNFCVGQGWIESNPVLPRLRLLKETRDPISLPQPDSVALMLARTTGGYNALLRAARATGARQEELAGVRWHQVDLERKRLTIVGKGNKRRTIDLEPFGAYEVFAGLSRGTPNAYVFTRWNGDRFKWVKSRFAALSRELRAAHENFVHFRYHDLRHLHAVEWLQSGRSIYDLKERLGHSSIQTTEDYLEFLTPEEKRAVKGTT
jgi:integrase/recombinase XerD